MKERSEETGAGLADRKHSTPEIRDRAWLEIKRSILRKLTSRLSPRRRVFGDDLSRLTS